MQKIIFITGVSGTGKTTLGQLLADHYSIPFFDGDDFHSEANIHKMTSGIPLQDDDRWEWLDAIHEKAKTTEAAIFACSALKESYRSRLCRDISKNDVQFIHLIGDRKIILNRMKKRKGHFMPTDLLDSQFHAFENPKSGILLDVAESLDILLHKIVKSLEAKSEIGVIGLGVMGTSIARNMGRNGFPISIYNRHVDHTEENVAKYKKKDFVELKNCQAFDDLPAFIDSLQSPKKILLMINAGKAVDDVLEQIVPILHPKYIIIDGGNSNYKDTQERYEALRKHNIQFIGCGISGGEEGALNGPSMMPGADKESYGHVRPIFEVISATSPLGGKCCSWIGRGGAGHFVKMVHNGIEYGEMQLIAECYSLLRYSLNQNPEQIADLFSSWYKDGLDSYLLEITIAILQTKDNNGEWVLDMILDKAGNKGTGAWTTIAAAEMGVAIPTITAALYARYQSFFKKERLILSEQFRLKNNDIIDLSGLKELYQFCRILNHRQGLQLILAASEKHSWNIDLKNLMKVWSAGCIIRSSLLIEITKGLKSDDFLNSKHFQNIIYALQNKAFHAYKNISSTGLPFPCISASMEYFKSLIQSDGNANMIQAQRDFFGAHTYRLKLDPDGKAHHYNWQKK